MAASKMAPGLLFEPNQSVDEIHSASHTLISDPADQSSALGLLSYIGAGKAIASSVAGPVVSAIVVCVLLGAAISFMRDCYDVIVKTCRCSCMTIAVKLHDSVSAVLFPRPPAVEVDMPQGLDVPKHVAIIMDGNRRYGRKHFNDASKGHAEGKWTRQSELVRVLSGFFVRCRGAAVDGVCGVVHRSRGEKPDCVCFLHW